MARKIYKCPRCNSENISYYNKSGEDIIYICNVCGRLFNPKRAVKSKNYDIEKYYNEYKNGRTIYSISKELGIPWNTIKRQLLKYEYEQSLKNKGNE